MAIVSLPILPLRDYQKPVWNYLMKEEPGLRAVLIWPRRNGKDLTSINLLAAKALQRKGLYLYIAPFANQVRSIIWEGHDGTGARFIDYIPKEIVVRKLDQQMKIWLSNGSLIQLVGSDNPDAIVGPNPLGIIFTEFPLHKPDIWQFMRPVLAENGGWAVFNGTPRGMNHFYQMAEMAEANEKWFYQKLTCLDTGIPSQTEIQEEREAGMPESLVDQEFYTSWVSSSEETLIPLDALEICKSTNLEPRQYDFALRIIGVDPAYAEKGDRAAIIRRQGRKVFEPWAAQGMDPMALASKVAMEIDSFQAHYCFVDAGRGEAVWSRLFQMGYEDKVIPIHFGGTSYEDLYRWKKDEMWGRMKNACCHPTMPLDLPDHVELIRDLSAPTFTLEKGVMQVESKKSLKKRGFRSTDFGDSLGLTYSEAFDDAPALTEHMRNVGITEEAMHKFNRQYAKPEENYDILNFADQYMKSKGSWVS